jgi:hypothetical protein
MSGRAELSDFERGRIVGAGVFESNKSEIARRLNHPRTTVITGRLRDGSGKDRLGSGGLGHLGLLGCKKVKP